LNAINYHFANSDNPVSVRIIRALELYDSGVTALSNWQSIYRYVASINVALPALGSKSKGKELVEQLKTLFQYGGKFVGAMKKADGTEYSSDGEPTWEEMVEQTAEPFVKFYALRGIILHGNIPSQVISTDDAEECRILAHNGIRLMALLAQEFNWQSDREAKKWFEKPVYPPSLNQETDED